MASQQGQEPPPAIPSPASGEGRTTGPVFSNRTRTVVRALGLLCLVLLATLAVALSATNFGSNDGPGIIRYGEFAVTHGRLANFEDISFGRDSEAPNFHHQWLTEIIAYGAWAGLGAPGVWAVKIIVLACVAMGLVLAGRKRLPLWFLALVAGLAFIALVPRILLRGDFLNLAFLALYAAHLSRTARTRRWKGLYWLVPAQLVWANIHPLAAAGAGLVLLFSMEQRFRIRGRKPAKAPGPAAGWHLALASLAVLAACLVTPYGARPFLANFQVLLGGGDVDAASLAMVGEFRPFFSMMLDEYLTTFVVLVLAALPAAALGRKKAGWWLILAWAAAVAGTLVHVRMMGFAAVLSAMVVVRGVSFVPVMVRHRWSVVQRAARPLAPLAAGLAALWLGWATLDSMQDGHYLRNDYYRTFGRLDANLRQPWRAAEFVATQGIEGRVFTNYDPGSFLALILPRGTFIYIDTQFLYSQRFFLHYASLVGDGKKLLGFLDEEDVDCVVLKHYSPDVSTMVLALQGSPAWTLAYIDECAVVYLPAGRVKGSIDIAVADPVNLLSRGRETDSRAYVTLGYFMGYMGQRDKAEKLYRTALGRDPRLFLAWNNLGSLYLEAGEYDRALACYVRCLQVKGNYEDARKRLRWILEGRLVGAGHPDYDAALELSK